MIVILACVIVALILMSAIIFLRPKRRILREPEALCERSLRPHSVPEGRVWTHGSFLSAHGLFPTSCPMTPTASMSSNSDTAAERASLRHGIGLSVFSINTETSAVAMEHATAVINETAMAATEVQVEVHYHVTYRICG